MSTPTREEIKVDVLAKLNQGTKAKTVAEDLNIPYATVLKWRREYAEAKADGEVASLVNVDSVVVHRVAEQAKEDLAFLGDETAALVEATEGKIEGAQLLNIKVQDAAKELAAKISEATNRPGIEARDISLLADALTKLQTSFFNKGATNINVLNQNNMDGSAMSTFQTLFKD